MILIELTVCFDTLYTAAKERKHAKYAELVASGRSAGYHCNLGTLEVRSRGFIAPDTVKVIKSLVQATKADFKPLVRAITCIKLSSLRALMYGGRATLSHDYDNPPVLYLSLFAIGSFLSMC